MLAALALIDIIIGLEQVEKEIELFQAGGQVKRGKDIYHHGPRPISITCHLPDPPCFSSVTTYKSANLRICDLRTAFGMQRDIRIHIKDLRWIELPGTVILVWRENRYI